MLVRCICQERDRDQANRLETYAALGNLSGRTFKTLRPRWRRGTADPDSIEAGVRIAKKFAKDPSGWLVITGPVRTGKSHIAAAITNQCAARGKPAKYVSALHLAEIVTSLDRWSEYEDAQSTWEALINAPILIIDDFGAQLSNARIDARLDQLLTVRADSPLPTVIVLSKRRDELPNRIRLRLIDDKLCNWIEILPRGYVETLAGQVPKRMLERMTFDTFNRNGPPSSEPDDQHSLSLAFDSAKNFPEGPGSWLHLHGEIGVGKTHLAVAIAGRVASLDYTPTFWRLPDLLDKLRDSFSDRYGGSFYGEFESVKNSELLILDDFMPPTMTDWTLEKLYQLVCHRSDRSLPTVTVSPYLIWEPESIDVDLRRRQAIDQRKRLSRRERMERHYWRQEDDYRDLKDKLLWKMIMSRIRNPDVVTERMLTGPDYRTRLSHP